MIIRHLILGFSFIVLSTGCGSLITLKSDLEQTAQLYQEFSVTTPSSSPEKRYLVMQLATLDKSGILTAHSITSNSHARFPSFFNLTEYVVVFEDSNMDFIYQSNEPSFLFNKTSLSNDKFVVSHEHLISDGIIALDGLSLTPFIEFEVKPERIGKIVDWQDPAFSEQAKEMGMWQPLAFVDNDYVGLFFLEAYQADKIPVLYIHGMGGEWT